MPIYEYKCPKCGKTSEEFRPAIDRSIPVGCECGAQQFLVPSLVEHRMKGRTRNINPFKIVPLAERMKAKYGDNE